MTSLRMIRRPWLDELTVARKRVLKSLALLFVFVCGTGLGLYLDRDMANHWRGVAVACYEEGLAQLQGSGP